MKYFLSLLLGSIFSFQMVAQDYKFEMGIQGGPSITRINYGNDPIADLFKSKMAFSTGLFFQYNINKNFSIRMDPGYESKGYHANFHFTDAMGNVIRDAKVTGHFNYITAPLFVRASVGNKVKYFINAGPYIGFLLSQNTKYDSPVYGKSKSNDIDSYKTFDFGISSGLGMAIPIKDRFALSIEARNNYGLTNISKSSSNNKTLSFNLLVGFAYKFRPK